MTRIDFYILQHDALIVRMHYACRLAEKAMLRGHHVVVSVDNENQAEALSHYLWSFKPESFLPHQLQHEAGQVAPIMIMWDQDREDCHDILINLSAEVPSGFSRFQRLLEVVVQEAECLTTTRSHFQFYRDIGYPLESHNIDEP